MTTIDFNLTSCPSFKRKISSCSSSSSNSSSDEDAYRCKRRSISGSCGFNLSHVNSYAKLNQENTVTSNSDIKARRNCFNYLVSAIDECWARYCSSKSHTENEVFGYDSGEFSGDETDLTEYGDDDEGYIKVKQQQQGQPLASLKAPQLDNFNLSWSARGSISSQEDESSCQLQELKDRLTRAKFFLQDLVDSDNYADVLSFWKRWDMIKYATIELVEDDDDDDVVEPTIDELEAGRLYL